MTLRLLDTFSGIGGFSLGARWLGGFQTVQFVERDPYCQRILRKHWPDAPIHNDICTFNPEPRSADVVCGGFPCQDISTAGKQAGIKEGTRSGLFYELMRVVRLVGPRYIVLENVAAITSNGLDTVLGTLAEAGFDAEWACIPAADVGACHRRDRCGVLPTPIRSDATETRTPEQTIKRMERLGRTGTSMHWPLSIAVQTLPTPTANDSKNASLPPSQEDRNGLAGAMLRDDSIPTGAATYLNPCFVEEMMGFPVGWTVSEP